MNLTHLFELKRTGKGKTAVIGWGRGMGHKGHMMLASSVITHAKELGADPYFVVSRTVGKDDPITPDEKLEIYKKVFPTQGHIFQAASDEIPDLTKVLANLNQQGYNNAVVVVGEDQVKAFQYLKNYNNKPTKKGDILYKFDTLDVIKRQDTSDPSKDQEGPRATPMRKAVMDPALSPEEKFKVWRDAMSPEISDDDVHSLMSKAKERMAQFGAKKKQKQENVEEGWGSDEITPYTNGYTIWHRKQSRPRNEPAYWVYKTPGQFKDWDDSMKWDLEAIIKKSQPIAKVNDITSAQQAMKQFKEETQRLDPKCWKGYRKEGTKMKGGKRVNNCVKVGEGWEKEIAKAISLLENKK